jgi:hypothetical protein
MDLTLQLIMDELNKIKRKMSAGQEELKNNICSSHKEQKTGVTYAPT